MAIRTSYFSCLDPDAIWPRCKEKCIVRDHLSYMDEQEVFEDMLKLLTNQSICLNLALLKLQLDHWSSCSSRQ